MGIKWEIKATIQDPKDSVFYHTSIVCGGKRVATSSGVGEEEAKTIATLIAAAPALLQELKDLVFLEKTAMTRKQVKMAISRAKDAIAKAEGRRV